MTVSWLIRCEIRFLKEWDSNSYYFCVRRRIKILILIHHGTQLLKKCGSRLPYCNRDWSPFQTYYNYKSITNSIPSPTVAFWSSRLPAADHRRWTPLSALHRWHRSQAAGHHTPSSAIGFVEIYTWAMFEKSHIKEFVWQVVINISKLAHNLFTLAFEWK